VITCIFSASIWWEGDCFCGKGKPTGGSAGTLAGGNRIELIDAAVMLNAVLGGELLDPRTLFFINREKETDADTSKYKEAVIEYENTFDDKSGRVANLEMMGERT
jgi:hypothetical protein